MVEQMFEIRQQSCRGTPPKFSPRSMKQEGAIRRLKGMITTLRPFAAVAARILALVAVAMLLVMVLLPAVLAAQAASS
jgi:hypothetical protein